MSGLGDAFGPGSAARQFVLWQVGGQMVGVLLAPALQEVQNREQSLFPVVPISPADAAAAVVRNFMDAGSAKAEAANSGISGDRFDTLVHLSGDAPGPQALAEALRRGLIAESGVGAGAISFQQGIAEGRLADKWADLVKELGVEWPTPNDALDALLEGQIDQSSAETLYAKFGGNPDYFQMLFDTRGSAPTPMEAIEMARRGIIPWDGTGPTATTFQQAFLEGPWRNKWEPAFRALATYVPPPRTVTAMLRSGAYTQAQALAKFQASGLSAEDAAAMVADASSHKTAAAKNLTATQMVTLYEDKLITEAQAVGMLESLGYDDAEAQFLLAMADFRRAAAIVSQAQSKIRSLYVGHKITRTAAVAELGKLKVPPDHLDEILAGWDVAAEASVPTLTSAQIATAVSDDIITQAEAMTLLGNLGHTDFDSWLILSNAAKGPLPDKPPLSAPGPRVNP
jgi:hypothetical protein